MRGVYVEDELLDMPESWRWPQGIVAREIDRETGRLVNEWCPNNRVAEYFIEGTDPTEGCSPFTGGLFGTPLRSTPPDTIVLDTIMRDTTDTALRSR
jgi:membrane carboxypeptidase/penicillin-binding protein